MSTIYQVGAVPTVGGPQVGVGVSEHANLGSCHVELRSDRSSALTSIQARALAALLVVGADRAEAFEEACAKSK